MNFQIAYFLPLFAEIINRFLSRPGNGAHPGNNIFRIGIAIVIKEMIITARQFIDLGHAGFNNIR